MNIMTNRR